MRATARRLQMRDEILKACKFLLSIGQDPTAAALRIECPGHCKTTLIRVRRELIESGEIDHTVLWPAWTDEFRVGLGPQLHFSWPGRQREKRRDARRGAVEVAP